MMKELFSHLNYIQFIFRIFGKHQKTFCIFLVSLLTYMHVYNTYLKHIAWNWLNQVLESKFSAKVMWVHEDSK